MITCHEVPNCLQTCTSDFFTLSKLSRQAGLPAPDIPNHSTPSTLTPKPSYGSVPEEKNGLNGQRVQLMGHLQAAGS